TRQLESVVDLVETVKLHPVGENAGVMGVTVKAMPLEEGEEDVHLALVVDVLGKDVDLERVARRAVDVEEILFLVFERPFAEELPAPLGGLAAADGGFELLACPEGGLFGGRVKL